MEKHITVDYDRCLAAEEIKQHYDAMMSGATPEEIAARFGGIVRG